MKEGYLIILMTIFTLLILLYNPVNSYLSNILSKSINKNPIEKIENISEEYPIAEISLEGFIKADVSIDEIFIDRAEVSLKAGCYLIHATTDACVAMAIKKGLEKKVDFRPTVYDVITDAFRNLGIRVLAVKIVEMRENTFIGQLIIQQRDKILALDIRPSDATAIALRVGAPIYINETLAKEVGEYIC